MNDPEVARFVAGLPKAELHVHLVGSASVPTVLALARRHPDGGVPTDEAALRAFYEFTDFAHFIEVYIAVNSLVREPEDVEALVVGVAADLAAQNVRYAELTVTPDSHVTAMGMAPEAVAEALTSARRAARAEHGVELAWIFDIPGELGLPSGERTIDWVEQHAPEGSVGFGLGGPEIGVGRPQFADVFARARAIGLHSVPHAGETTGPETIWDALRHLGAERVGHGIAAAQDPALLAHLAEHGIPLEVCPTSNLRTRAVERIEDHPFTALRDAGVVVTLSSDDPGMFDTTLQREYQLAHDVFGLDRGALVDLAQASVDASFATDDVRRSLTAEIEAHRDADA
ncbi:adenosine deaminase [Solicola sp. PLA-1-18]|uniref:adenosine deaminase n=1 Tax=Solicola sp. PLA-1-18 TaxID=3380532 RepID=UPI003B79A326